MLIFLMLHIIINSEIQRQKILLDTIDIDRYKTGFIWIQINLENVKRKKEVR